MAWWSGSSGYLMVGLDIYQHGDPNSGSVQLEVVYRVKADGYGHNFNSTLHRWGRVSGDVGFHFSSPRGSYAEAEVNRETITVNTEYGRSQDLEFSASIGPIWNGGNPSITQRWTVPARAYGAPATPSNFQARYLSEGRVECTWGLNVTGDHPVDMLDIWRWSYTSGEYRLAAQLPASARSWTDTNVPSDDFYRWRIHAWRRDGSESAKIENSSPSPQSMAPGDIAMTPGAPVNVRAVKQASGAINVSWERGARYPDRGWGAEIYDNGTKVADVAGDARAWTHASPNAAVSHVYQVRQKGPGGLLSPLSERSNTVQLLTNPGTPGSLSPAGVPQTPGTVTLSWTHTSIDTTVQTRADVRWRKRGSANWGEATVSGDRHTYSPVFNEVGEYEWQVRTWGAYKTGQEAGASPWSPVTGFKVAHAPIVSLAEPAGGSVVHSSSTRIRWSYSQAEGSAQRSAAIQVIDEATGQAIASTLLEGTASSWDPGVRLEDRQAYLVRVTASSGDGLSSAEATSRFTVSYLPPAAPSVLVRWDDTTGAASIGITNPTGVANTVPAVSNSIERSIDDGKTWEKIADHLPVDTTLQDGEALSNGKTIYRVSATSATPSTATTSVALEADSQALWVSGGTGFATSVPLRYDPETSIKPSLLTRKVHYFAGRTRGVEVTGSHQVRTITLGASLHDRDYRLVQALEALAVAPAPFLYRDPLGRRIYCSMSSMSAPREVGGMWKVSVELEEVEK